MNIKVAILGYVLLMLLACGKKKTAFSPDFPTKNTEELVQRLDELSQLDWDFLTAKTNVKISSADQNNSFKASLRMKRDSALLVNISFAGIPIVQTVLSNDSLKLLNRKDKCFKFQDRSALEQIVDFPIEYFQLQDLLIGKPLLFDKNQEHIQIQDLANYQVKTKRKRSQQSSNEEVIITYFLHPTSLELNKVKLESPYDKTTMEIIYIGKHEKIEGLSLPQQIDLIIQGPQSTTTINISYNRPDISNEKKISLNVPENYVPCP
jgi:hypothetical protein